MLNITVIGANSYIARNLVYLIKQQLPDTQLFLYDAADIQIDGLNGYEQIDILSKESVKKINLCSDIIFMFVGKTGSAAGFDNFDIFIDINEKALLNVLNEYRRQESKAKLIFPSTRLLYDNNGDATENEMTKELKTIYAINKFACEQYLQVYHKVYNVQYCIFRICIPYGSLISNASSYGTAEFMLSKAEKGEDITLFGDGSQRRTLTYIEDLCNILLKGALCSQCVNSIYNVGGENYSLAEMAKLIADKYGVKVVFAAWSEVEAKIESGDTVFNSDKIDKILQYKRKMNFAEWIAKK